MPAAWSQLHDVGRLADGQAEFEFAIPLTALPRVQAQLAGAEGTVEGHVRFTRESGFAVAELEVHGTVPLTCQRCLQGMQWPVKGQARIALIAAEPDMDRVPEHLEPLLAPGGRISIRDLVDEEMLFVLPIVPLHPQETGCPDDAAVRAPAPTQEAPAVQRPFERLGELLKRNS